jgi:hypothetical protein
MGLLYFCGAALIFIVCFPYFSFVCGIFLIFSADGLCTKIGFHSSSVLGLLDVHEMRRFEIIWHSSVRLLFVPYRVLKSTFASFMWGMLGERAG